jgi:hypothetical protein
VAALVTYTEDDIRKAWKQTGLGTFSELWLESLITALNEKKDHVHDFADTDIITVKELREAWNGRTVNGMIARNNQDPEALLRNISEHREPGYEIGTVVKDNTGCVYLRLKTGWWRFGSSMVFEFSAPKRPLFRMTELP